MNPLGLALLLGPALAVVLFAAVGFWSYNGVVAMRQRIDKAWGNVDVALQQRHDELPRLVESVRGVMSYEQDVLTEVTRLRAAYSPTSPIPEQAATSEATTRAVRSLFAVVERYPELRSHENVASLQAEIQRLETVIADRRELYNDSTYRYNTAIAQLPGQLFAGLFGWQPRPFFRAEADAATPPEVAIRPES